MGVGVKTAFNALVWARAEDQHRTISAAHQPAARSLTVPDFITQPYHGKPAPALRRLAPGAV